MKMRKLKSKANQTDIIICIVIAEVRVRVSFRPEFSFIGYYILQYFERHPPLLHKALGVTGYYN